MGRGRGRNNRTQRRHFKQNRENVWKDSESDPQPSTAGEGIAAIAVNTNRNNSRDTGWNPFVTENVFFEEYYKGQGIVLPDEWDTFMEILRKPLPSAFRINSSGQFYLDILSQLENDFVKSLQTEFIEGDEAAAIRPLPWYPENLAWHSNFSRKEIRKNQTLERFHEFLKLANDIGNITRQEAVSMVPPLFLDVHPDHFVLDMCAAPGSKTFQLLEIIHQSSQPGALPCGMVIANDVDIQRSNLLIHQTKRMCTANLVVTNHEAQNFPGCNLRKHNFKASEARTAEGLAMNQLLFDRVLCDVPCSGDGTLRKAPDMWRRWNTGMGNGLHNLQLLIAMRGMSLLKVGGRMVYSTCSMNPVENEAVVAEILRRCKDSVELVDVSKELPQLVRRPGLKSWKVWDKGQWLVSYKDVKKYRRVGIMPSMFPSGRADTYSPNNNDVGDPDSGDMRVISVEPVSENGLHGKTEEFVSSSAKEEFSCFPLEHCMRIVPHDQNTGAFFIAVFHKLSPIPVLGVEEPLPCETINFESGQDDNVSDAGESEATNGESSKEMVIEDSTGGELPKASLESEKPFDTVSKDEAFPGDLKDEPCCITEANGAHDGPENRSSTTGLGDAGGKRKLQTQGRWKGVDPVLFYKDENVIYCIKTFYGIVDSFPLNGHLISRNIDNNHVKRIYYISKSVKDILELNLLVGHQLKLASVGVKMFERQTSQDGHGSSCLFRISSEGLPLLLPYITKQILHVSAHDLCHLLQKKSVKFGDFVTAESGEKASQLLLGCCVVALEEDGPLSADPVNVCSSTIAIGCWRGRTNISVMVAANDCQDLLDRLLARMEAKGISLPEKVDSSGLEVKGDRQCRNELKGEMNEAVKLDEVKCSS